MGEAVSGIDAQDRGRRLDQPGIGLALHLAAEKVLAIKGQIAQPDVANAFGLRLAYRIGDRRGLVRNSPRCPEGRRG